jgi:hypothetical protein
MIIDRYDSRTFANMEVALEEGCKMLSDGETHEARRHIAKRILRCARKGEVSLGRLTEEAQIAASELCLSHGG